MKRFLKVFCVFLIVFAFCAGTISAQSLEERLQSMAKTNAKLYVTPLVTAFGSGMNSGWFHSAKPHKLLGFDVGVRIMAVTFPEDQKVFDFDISALDFTNSITINESSYDITLAATDLYPETEVPTFFGESEAGKISAIPNANIVSLIETQLLNQGVPQQVLDHTDTQDKLNSFAELIPDIPTPAGTGLEMLPLIVPQAAIGLSLPMLPIKAEIVVRGLPEIELEDVGKFKFFGLGGKLALDPFIPIPMFPINIALGTYIQKMTIGDVFESNHSLLSLQVGKDLNLVLLALGVYAGVGLESSNVKINYTYFNEDDPEDIFNNTEIKFDIKGDNKFRTTVGARVRLAVLNISADYSMGADNVLTIGAGLSIR
ncbi:MAG: hypothetical protein ISS81_01285 [Candidatus Marinimicrobia bacterium]|nr:hypothetical protein [Candidatus Neomarinimicrobiota bacterium]